MVAVMNFLSKNRVLFCHLLTCAVWSSLAFGQDLAKGTHSTEHTTPGARVSSAKVRIFNQSVQGDIPADNSKGATRAGLVRGSLGSNSTVPVEGFTGQISEPRGPWAL